MRLNTLFSQRFASFVTMIIFMEAFFTRSPYSTFSTLKMVLQVWQYLPEMYTIVIAIDNL